MAVDLFSLRMKLETTGEAQATAGLKAVEAQGARTAAALNGTAQGSLHLTRQIMQQEANAKVLAAQHNALGNALGRVGRDVSAATADFKAGRISQADWTTAMLHARSELNGFGSATTLTSKQLREYNNIVKQTSAAVQEKASMTGLLSAGLRQLAVLYGGMKLIGFISDTIRAAGSLHELSQRTGATVETLSVLQFVANQTDVSMAQVALGFRGMALSLGRLRDGQDLTVEAFARLGFTAESFKGLNPDQTFLKLAAAVAGVKDETERAELAQKVFGRTGEQLLPLLIDITEKGFARWREETEKNGGLVTKDMADKADAFSDAVTRLGVALGGLMREVLLPLLGPLATFVSLLAEGVKNLKLLRAALPGGLGNLLGGPSVPEEWLNKFSDVEGGASSSVSVQTLPEIEVIAPTRSGRTGTPLPAAPEMGDLGTLANQAPGMFAPDRLPGGSSTVGVRGRLDVSGALTAPQPQVATAWDQFQQEVIARGQAVRQSFQMLGTNLGMTLANGFAAAMDAGMKGKNIFKAFGKAVLSGLGNIFKQMGAELLAYGIIMLNLLPFLSNPFTSGPAAIAAGAALIALGAALGAIAGGGGSGSKGGSAGALRDRETVIHLTANGAGGFTAPTKDKGQHFTVLGKDSAEGQRLIGEFVGTARRSGHRI